jgi:hypothetical protein
LKFETIMLTITIVLAIALAGRLIVVPAVEETGLLQQAEEKERHVLQNARNPSIMLSLKPKKGA